MRHCCASSFGLLRNTLVASIAKLQSCECTTVNGVAFAANNVRLCPGHTLDDLGTCCGWDLSAVLPSVSLASRGLDKR